MILIIRITIIIIRRIIIIAIVIVIIIIVIIRVRLIIIVIVIIIRIIIITRIIIDRQTNDLTTGVSNLPACSVGGKRGAALPWRLRPSDKSHGDDDTRAALRGRNRG